jgi:hypothetical protein
VSAHDLPSAWRQAAAQVRLEAAKYSPRGARQAFLRGQADSLERCANDLEAALSVAQEDRRS